MSDPILVELARVAAGLTQGALAKKLGKSQPFISQVERGEKDIPAELLPAWAAACNVPPAFFERRTLPLGDGVAAMVHRRMKTLPAKPFHTASAQVQMRALELDSLFAEVDVHPSLELPTFPLGTGAADAARSLRQVWRVPRGPLPNLVELIESAGIPVVPMDQMHEKHSAVSHRGHHLDWMIAVNASHPASRQRYSLAHELGHIVLGHERVAVGDDISAQDLEDAADAFAAELLVPASEATRELRGANFQRLVALKQRWRVSIAYLIQQQYKHSLIDADQRRWMFIQLNRQPGGRRREPAEFPVEQPTLVARLIQSLRSAGLTDEDIASAATMLEDDMRVRYLGEQRRLRAVTDRPTRTVLRLADDP